MAGQMFSNTLFQSYSKVLQKVYIKRAKEEQVQYPNIFNRYEGDKKRPFFSYLPVVELGTFSLKPEGQGPSFDQLSEGTASTWQYLTYALGYKITEEADNADPFNLMKRLPNMMAYSSQITKELLIWNILNLAFNATVKGSDGLPLCSTAHTLGNAPGVTVSNSAGATALTPESLQAARVAMETLVSDRNLPSYRTPQDLIVHPALMKTAEEITGSPMAPYSNDGRINTLKGKVTPYSGRYLTTNTNWFVTASKGDIEGDTHSMMYSLQWDDRQVTATDPITGNFNHIVKFRIAFGFGDFRGVYGSQGA